MIIQTARNEHIPGIQSLALGCHISKQADANESFVVELPSENQLRAIIEDDLSRVILDGKEVIGHFLVCSEQHFDRAYGKSFAQFIGMFGGVHPEPNSAYAEQICIHRAWRRKGLYKSLLEDAEHIACQRGITGFYGDIFCTNAISLMIHEKMGWKRIGVMVKNENGVQKIVWYLVYKKIDDLPGTVI